MWRDGSSGGVVRLVTISKDGVEKQMISGYFQFWFLAAIWYWLVLTWHVQGTSCRTLPKVGARERGPVGQRQRCRFSSLRLGVGQGSLLETNKHLRDNKMSSASLGNCGHTLWAESYIQDEGRMA